ncbi:MAG: endo-1,4-beta-xylanase [Lewinellaceae bacterium]|nr:endo-1,4-beta-xylanase [Lewinellaceae bacterium]
MKRNILLFTAFMVIYPLLGQMLPLDGVFNSARIDSHLGAPSGTDPIAAGKPKFLGCAYGPAQAFQFAEYWNQITTENAGKWGSVEAVQDVMDWAALDDAYNLAKDNGFIFKLHVLVWGNQQPAWIEDLTPSEQLVQIKEWFQALASRYPEIDVIEVVNEPLHDPPNSPGSGGGNYIEALGGTGTTGYDWVIQAFTLAREYFPGVQLMLNEYGILNDTPTANEYKLLIELLKDEGLIDQVGVQAHYFTTSNATVWQINHILDILAETDLPIFITEMDIQGPTDQVQLEEFQRVFPEFWKHPAVRGITLWGFRPGLWVADANLIRPDGTERPALIWLRNFVTNFVLTTMELGNSEDIRVFPNPAAEGFFIDGVDVVERVALVNMQGQLIQVEKPASVYFSLSQNVGPGLYVALIFTSQEIFVKKVVVEGKQ